MSLNPMLSFSSGELDPILHDNVTLEKFKKGLATARNVMVGKTGSLLSRFSTQTLVNARYNNQRVKLYNVPNLDVLSEWGVGYVRLIPLVGSPFDIATSLTDADLDNLHFTSSGSFVYVFIAGSQLLKLKIEPLLTASAFVSSSDIFKIVNPPTDDLVQVTGSAGYRVDYFTTIVYNGEESEGIESSDPLILKPIAAGQSNVVNVRWVHPDAVDDTEFIPSEMRVYERPFGGGAFGFLGSSTKFVWNAVDDEWEASFEDLGSLPDYANGVQDLITNYGLEGIPVEDLDPKTGIIYQQCLLLANLSTNKEAIIKSRPGYQNNFYRDFPYSPDSALNFKAGTSGKAEVLRMIDSDGLIVFTTNGVYVSVGLLSVDNSYLDKRGGWIINESLPPLVVPGGLFFVDRTNVIRQLVFSQDILTYESIEQTIFSNHLFRRRTITSWTFQEGVAPLIIVTFSDGTFATFTYNYEHQMRAWTRHDSVYPVEQVESSGLPDKSYFVVNKNGQRQIQFSLPRYVSATEIVADQEADMNASNTFMDGIVSTKRLVNVQSLGSGSRFTLTITAINPGDWEGTLNINSDVIMIPVETHCFTPYSVGDVFRFFNPDDNSFLNLEIVTKTDDDNVIVQPSEEFPSEYAANPNIYETFDVITGLTALEGEVVSVVADGSLVASPNNDEGDYPELTVTGGEITLPNSLIASIIHVGRPITADIKTLNVSTVEQSPTLIESLNVGKLYIRIHETRGLYCSNTFPEEKTLGVDGSSVVGMESLDEQYLPGEADLIGNSYASPVSKRIERTLPGDWSTQGQIAIRQVDPYPFEILSIIPDIEILRRSDR